MPMKRGEVVEIYRDALDPIKTRDKEGPEPLDPNRETNFARILS